MSRLPVVPRTTSAVTRSPFAHGQRARKHLGVLCAWVCMVWTLPAAAVEVIYVSPAGVNGLNGTTPGMAGTDGTAALAAVRNISSADSQNVLLVRGGAGGHGGDGGEFTDDVQGGLPGMGGAGALGAATLGVITSSGPVDYRLEATGGAGGNAGLSGDWRAVNNVAAGGAGGNGQATGVLNATGAGPVRVSASATGGAGGDAYFGKAGKGGSATTVLDITLNGSRNATITGAATGGSGGSAGVGSDDLGGGGGDAGNASSRVAVTAAAPASNAWDAVINATSTATGGEVPLSAGAARGTSADATLSLNAYGRSSGTAVARGGTGYEKGEDASAHAVVSSSYSAVASADARGGDSYRGTAAGARAYAQASGGYHARAEAVAVSGSGSFGWGVPASATAVASVHRQLGAPPAPVSDLPAEARAHALASRTGSQVVATSSYRDDSRQAAVHSSVSASDGADYAPEASSAANVGGAAYGAWQSNADNPGHVIAYASALPDQASLAPLLATAPQVRTAFGDASVLGAGTIGGALVPFDASARYTLPFNSGEHLLLGLFNPVSAYQSNLVFSFTVSQGDTILYSISSGGGKSFDALFGDQVIDLGAVQDDTLDLLVHFTLNSGAAAFNYTLGSVAVVPEPSTWLLLMLGLTILGWRAGKLRRAD